MDRMIFINITWMSSYAGLEGAHTSSSSGHGYVKRHGYGHEMFNFKPLKGKVYGTAPFPRGVVKIEKLGAEKGAESVDGVLVVWVAKSVIVGWYENATVYRHSQVRPQSHFYKGKPIGYRAVAAEKDCKLILPPDARFAFGVPRAWQRKNAMGRFTWFADGAVNRSFQEKVRKYVAAGGDISKVENVLKAGRLIGVSRQADPRKRSQVETTAVNLITKHYESQKYDVRYVGHDNLGWDLNARHRVTGRELKLEVKGLSGSGMTVELTPNEYAMMNKHKVDYRICVVTNCLRDRAKRTVFAYNESVKSWTDEDDRPLRIKEMTAARLQLA
jgi:hypothetical protein